MKPGDCINIPIGVKHWHGAAPDEWFSHLAIEVPGENSSTEWLEPVSDEEYRKLKQDQKWQSASAMNWNIQTEKYFQTKLLKK